MTTLNQKTVFVGLSGGVDSSVAALRLLREGYTVVGVFIKVWQPDWLDCNWEAERLDAMRVAAHLNIPFLTCDAEQAYRDSVATYFIEEYKVGRTPNPDVMCNQHVKFGAFLEFAISHGADYIATGHYAQVQPVKNDPGDLELIRGIDTDKDQTYFLWTLTQAQLKHILLPVGRSTKKTIRKEAAAAGIPTAQKKDSQGVCFLGHINIPEFLSHYTTLIEGSVLDINGEVIGTHDGALLFTEGQRHGFTLDTHNDTREAMYVVAKDIKNNTITVSSQKATVAVSQEILLTAQNTFTSLTVGSIVQAQFRYRQKPFFVTVTKCAQGELKIKLQYQNDMPASGQSCVLYDGVRCLGGGIIG